MIQFRVADAVGQPSPIEIIAKVDSVGDVEILANGVTVLWILAKGTICRNGNGRQALADMGFRLDGAHHIEVSQ